MKQVNKKDIIIFLLIIAAIGYLKSVYLASMDISNITVYFICYGDNQLINVIWLLPILIQIFFISKQAFLELCHFDFRYKNRKTMIYKCITRILFLQLFYTLLSFISQLIVISLFIPIKLDISVIIFYFIIKYYLEILWFILLLLLVSIFSNEYTITLTCMTVIHILGISSLSWDYLPFTSLYRDCLINPITIIMIPIIMIILRYYFLKKDLLGGE